jgi:Cu(I)/Ag(I) efflux system membrane fusion protein
MLSALLRYRRGVPALLAAALLIFLLGLWAGRAFGPDGEPRPAEAGAGDAGGETIWTCSMHPQIRETEPGDCRICGMELIPVQTGEEALGPRTMSMSEEAMRLAEVETVTAVRRFVDVEIPLVGKVDYDETRVKTIAAWVPGRLERLFVDYTGVPVRKGDHLVEIYSPELYAAQEELLQAIRAVEKLQGSASDIVRRSSQATVEAAREKLRRLGLSRQQIREVEERASPSATVQINAPVGGIVIHKNAKEGMYVEQGEPIYTLADLSRVWVLLDAYESDIAWLRYGQEVEIKTEAYGDRTFQGWISFIDPVLDPQTRTVKVRVVVTNVDGMLRPNMFARAVVRARIAAGGDVVTRNLKGKWISPMHPEVIQDEPGTCDVCGMPLVKAEELNYLSEEEARPPLVVPASAVLTTGERAIVYVRVPGRERPTFRGVEVTVGPRAGEYYPVRSGLEAGAEVVVNGNFKIDAALQLLAKPSMMTPQDDGPAPGVHAAHAPPPAAREAGAEEPAAPAGRLEVPAGFRQELAPLYAAYLEAQRALAADREPRARTALDELADALAAVDASALADQAQREWQELARQLEAALEHRLHRPGVDGARGIFQKVSEAVIRLERRFGHAGAEPHRVAFCPMADENRGAAWLQTGETVKNPYYGEAMLRCGEIRETFPGGETAED